MRNSLVPHQMCTRKEPFKTKREAEKDIEWYAPMFGSKMRAYKCPLCSKWHVGNKS